MRTLLRIEEVAVLVGVSIQTINNWYRFKKLNPDDEFAKLLPDYERLGSSRQRFWDKADVNQLIAFKRTVPRGCKGIMGEVTQKYVKAK